MMRMVFAVRRRRRVYEEHAAAFVSGNAHQDNDAVGDIRRANLRIRREAERQPKMIPQVGFVVPRPARAVAEETEPRANRLLQRDMVRHDIDVRHDADEIVVRHAGGGQEHCSIVRIVQIVRIVRIVLIARSVRIVRLGGRHSKQLFLFDAETVVRLDAKRHPGRTRIGAMHRKRLDREQVGSGRRDDDLGTSKFLVESPRLAA